VFPLEVPAYSDDERNAVQHFSNELDCAALPIRRTLDHITSRWGALVLLALGERQLRFSQLHRALGGVSEKMLAQTLRLLDADGLVERRACSGSPGQGAYCLTALGQDLAPHLRTLLAWIVDHATEIRTAPERRTALKKPGSGFGPDPGSCVPSPEDGVPKQGLEP
jgi:DNA-binding HxlR family transcriptional regulator